MKVLGAPQEAIDAWTAEFSRQEEAQTIVLPADCRQAVAAFLAVDTQWNKLLAGDRLVATGLDYAGVAAALGLMGLSATPGLFADLQVMEREALAAMAER